jgi:hypothetical protein
MGNYTINRDKVTLEKGSLINLTRIETAGKVIRSDKSGVAIQFDNRYKIRPLGK